METEDGSSTVQELEQKVARAEQVKEIINRIHSAKDLDHIVVDLRDDILQVLDAELLTLYVVDAERREIYSKFLDIDKIRITTGDTDVAPMTGLSAGSKTIYTVGAAVLQAAEDARRQTFEIAAAELEASVHDLELVDGKVTVRGAPNKGITLAAIGKKGNLYMSKTPPVLGKANPAFTQQAPAFAAQLARLELDPDTGEVTLLDFVVVQDVGKAINPMGVAGQMQGGAVQSIGMALTEGLLFDDSGRLTNPSLLDYRKLTAADLPNLETIIVEVPAPAGPFGARGVGEPPIIPAPAAIANAIQNATGARLTELPMSPERIALALVNGKH